MLTQREAGKGGGDNSDMRVFENSSVTACNGMHIGRLRATTGTDLIAALDKHVCSGRPLKTHWAVNKPVDQSASPEQCWQRFPSHPARLKIHCPCGAPGTP